MKFDPFSAAGAVGSMTGSYDVITPPDVCTFHMPTTRCATPRFVGRGDVLTSCTFTLNVHVPVGKLTLPAPSTSQPRPVGAMGGVVTRDAVTGVVFGTSVDRGR